MREGGVGIDDGTVEGETLTLVDGNGPGKLQRILTETPSTSSSTSIDVVFSV